MRAPFYYATNFLLDIGQSPDTDLVHRNVWTELHDLFQEHEEVSKNIYLRIKPSTIKDGAPGGRRNKEETLEELRGLMFLGSK